MESVIYLAGGCFWGIQGYFDKLSGTLDSAVGYANSLVDSPSYEMVCSGASGAVETLELIYDSDRISLDEITARLLSIIDPCALNYQGNDIGTQYRSGIYYLRESAAHDEPIITKRIRFWEQHHGRKSVLEIQPLQNFYPAEPYHQRYLQAHPQGYCHIDIESALREFVLEPLGF